MWYSAPQWRPRVVAERMVMAERFPQFRLFIDEDGFLRWEGLLEPVPGRRFRVSVSYPRRYPYDPPKLTVDDPPLEPDAPHRYLDGSLCVHRSSWNPETVTAASTVPLVSAWLIGYLNWLESREAF
jgi:ubiquitin-protein ligase